MKSITIPAAQHAAITKIITQFIHLADRSPNIAFALGITREDQQTIERFLITDKQTEK